MKHTAPLSLNRLERTALALGAALALTTPAVAADQPAPKPTALQVQLGQYTLPDTFLHCTAWTFVAPVDWEKEGGVYWTGKLLPLAYYSQLTIRNPKGSEQLQLFPTAIYVATDNPMSAAGRSMSPYLQADQAISRMLMPQYRPQARQVHVVAVDRQASQLVSEAAARTRTQGVSGCDIRAARMLVDYEENGKAMREMFFCTLAAPRLSGPTTWCIERALGLRAEAKDFDQHYRLLGLMASSLRENQQWVQARGRQLRAMVPPPTARSGSSGPSILDVSKSISRNNDQFLKNIDALNTARLNSPASDGWTRAYRNTESMVNPSTGEQVEVTGGYLQYYQDYSGRIYASRDPTDFYLQTRMGGTVLEPAP